MGLSFGWALVGLAGAVLAPQETTNYSYDVHGRLQTVRVDPSGATPDTAVCYNLDNADNRGERLTVSPPALPCAPTLVTVVAPSSDAEAASAEEAPQ